MRIKRIIIGLSMIMKMVLRRKVILFALIIIPLVFLTVVNLTAPVQVIPFRLASLQSETFIWESMKQIALIFFSIASSGFLVSLLALNLVQIENDVNRRLVICGFHPFELLLSNLLSLLLFVILIAVYIGTLVSYFVEIENFFFFLLGLMLIGFVYGCYGLSIGSLIKGKLEGIFFIILLANIDAGWLQNPMYYAEAQNNVIIRYLPAYFPSQSAIIAAFTDYSSIKPAMISIFYGAGFLLLALFIFYKKMSVRK